MYWSFCVGVTSDLTICNISKLVFVVVGGVCDSLPHSCHSLYARLVNADSDYSLVCVFHFTIFFVLYCVMYFIHL